MRYELTDYEWAAIKPMLPNKARGEAPALPVAQPSRSSATGSIDNSPGGIFLH
jgi:transposase